MNTYRKMASMLPERGRLLQYMGSVLFGFANGFTIGLLDTLRDQFRAMYNDPVCLADLNQIKAGFNVAINASIMMLAGVASREARGGASLSDWVRAKLSVVMDASMDAVKGLWHLVTTCEPVRALIMMLVFMVIAGVAFTLLLWALPGLGWIAYVVGVITTLFFGIPFLWKTLKMVAAAVKGLMVTRPPDERVAQTCVVIEGISAVLGFLLCVFVTSGASKLFSEVGRAEIVNRLGGANKMMNMVKDTLKPSTAAINKFQSFKSLLSPSLEGKAGNAGSVITFAKEKNVPGMVVGEGTAAKTARIKAQAEAAVTDKVTFAKGSIEESRELAMRQSITGGMKYAGDPALQPVMEREVDLAFRKWAKLRGKGKNFEAQAEAANIEFQRAASRYQGHETTRTLSEYAMRRNQFDMARHRLNEALASPNKYSAKELQLRQAAMDQAQLEMSKLEASQANMAAKRLISRLPLVSAVTTAGGVTRSFYQGSDVLFTSDFPHVKAATLNFPAAYSFFEQYPECRKPAASQDKDCGSCWAFASVGAISHRLCKAVSDAGGEQFTPSTAETAGRLSVQMGLSCAQPLYNAQHMVVFTGDCRGGAPVRVYEYARDKFLYPSKCGSYTSWKVHKANLLDGAKQANLCQQFQTAPCPFARGNKVTIAGAAVLSGAPSIKQAIWEGGPVTAIMKTPQSFEMFEGPGVYEAGTSPWVGNDASGLASFHVVQIVGWGADDRGDYWIVENSWGPQFKPWDDVHNQYDTPDHGKRGPIVRMRAGYVQPPEAANTTDPNAEALIDSNDLGLETNPVFFATVKLWKDGKKVDVAEAWN